MGGKVTDANKSVLKYEPWKPTKPSDIRLLWLLSDSECRTFMIYERSNNKEKHLTETATSMKKKY